MATSLVCGVRPAFCRYPAQPVLFTARRAASPKRNRSFGNRHVGLHTSSIPSADTTFLLRLGARNAALSFSAKTVGVAAVGLGLSSWFNLVIHCEGTTPVDQTPSATVDNAPPGSEPIPPPPASSVNVYELSFGTVCGICAGVFIKKGVKMMAFVLGGVFVLMQYLGHLSVVRVDWGAIGQKFEGAFYTTDNTGKRHPPTITSIWNRLVDFLLADFQPRASFIAGFVLGLRLG